MKGFYEIIMQIADALNDSFMREYECYFAIEQMKECNSLLNSSIINEYADRENTILLWCRAVFNSSYSDIAEAYSDSEIIGGDGIGNGGCTKSYLSDLHSIVNGLSSKLKLDDMDIDNFYGYVSSVTNSQENYDLLVG